ncbi:MAG: DUF3786 domain-containing protein [Deltaproteobacteria bacterium]|nr:DUF3786 domain-containing protein [Deltaproteobacteria bacterium]
MARIDDYKHARSLSIKELEGKDIESIARFSGAVMNHDSDGQLNALSIRFLNRDVIISHPGMKFSYKDTGDDVPLQDQVLILHYLVGAGNSGEGEAVEKWVSFQDLPEGRFYMDSFIKRAKEPLLRTFGSDPKKMAELAERMYGAFPIDFGDFSMVVRALPMVPVALVLWQGDDEFPPEGNILFGHNISGILPAEDIALLAGMVVYPMVGMAKR